MSLSFLYGDNGHPRRGERGEDPLNDIHELRREDAALRARLALLSSAILRINSSLDLSTVAPGDHRQCPGTHRRVPRRDYDGRTNAGGIETSLLPVSLARSSGTRCARSSSSSTTKLDDPVADPAYILTHRQRRLPHARTVSRYARGTGDPTGSVLDVTAVGVTKRDSRRQAGSRDEHIGVLHRRAARVLRWPCDSLWSIRPESPDTAGDSEYALAVCHNSFANTSIRWTRGVWLGALVKH